MDYMLPVEMFVFACIFWLLSVLCVITLVKWAASTRRMPLVDVTIVSLGCVVCPVSAWIQSIGLVEWVLK